MKAEIRLRKKFLTVSGECNIELLQTLKAPEDIKLCLLWVHNRGDLNFCVRCSDHCGTYFFVLNVLGCLMTY